MVIRRGSSIISLLHENNALFQVYDNYALVIDGGVLDLQVQDEASWDLLFQEIKSKDEFVFRLVQGEYSGSFDEIKLAQYSKTCERIAFDQHIQDKLYYLNFFIDDSECAGVFSWWVILLIVLGGILVLATIAVILIFKVERISMVVFPYRRKYEVNA